MLSKKHLLIIVLAGLPLGGSTALAASAGTIYLSPGTQNLSTGQNISVEIHEDSGSTSVNVAQVALAYPADQLKLVSVDNSTAFGVPVGSDTASNGSVKLSRAAFPAPASGDNVIATLEFQVLAPAGSSIPVNFSGPQTVLSSTTHANVITSAANAAYSVPAPAPAPAATKPAATDPKPIPGPTADQIDPTTPLQATTAPLQHDFTSSFTVKPPTEQPTARAWPAAIPVLLASAMAFHHWPRRVKHS